MLRCPDLRVPLQVVGLYRLCGSAAVKKELREAFERDSHAVELCENMYPDVNVITGTAQLRNCFSVNALPCSRRSVHKQPFIVGAALGCYITHPVHKNIVFPMTVSEQVIPKKPFSEKLELPIVFWMNQMVQK